MSLAAVRAGARQIQGTLNGLGERCGNANLCSLLPTLMLKEPYASQFETGVTREQLAQHHPGLAPAGRNPQPRAEPPCAPMSGRRPSRTRAGCIPPPCRRTRAPTSMCRRKRSATRARFWCRIRRAAPICWRGWPKSGIDVDAKDARVARLLEEVKQREFLGYAYDGAEASFELLARRALGQVPDYFDGRKFPRHRRAPPQCARRTRHRFRSAW